MLQFEVQFARNIRGIYLLTVRALDIKAIYLINLGDLVIASSMLLVPGCNLTLQLGNIILKFDVFIELVAIADIFEEGKAEVLFF
jgi:hypothetical protein